MLTTMRLSTVVLSAAVTFSVAVASRGFASEDGHGDEGHGAEGHHGAAGNEAAVPDTVAGLWHAIDEKVEQLDETIESGELAKVHEIAFAIRDLARQLPERSSDLSDAKKKLLDGLIERVAEHAKNLDNYGDAGKAEETAREFGQLETRLDHMRKLYPASQAESRDSEHEHH